MKYYDLVLSPRLRRGMTWAAVAGGGAAALVAYVARSIIPDAGADVVAALAGFAFILVAAPLAGTGLLLYHLRETTDQTQKLLSIRPLLGELPPPLGGWSIDPRFGELIVQTITATRPRLVLECGAGTSTILAAATLRQLGAGRVVSLENYAESAEQTRARLAAQGLSEWAHVITAPLAPRTVEGREYPWYQLDGLADVAGEIDVLIVDGPHGKLTHMARYPAVPVLKDRLAAGCTVLMDDGSRPDERRIAKRWSQLLGGTKRYFSFGRGAWLLQRGS